MYVFADPKSDFVFKRIFGVEARKHLLVALLNDLLELEGDRRVVDLVHLTPDQRSDVAELKLSIVDVKCTDASGRHFVVEMQVLKVEGFEKRVVYNTSKAYVAQLRNGDEYPALCDVVGVTLCNFCLWTELDDSGAYKVPMLSRWRMQEQHSGERGLSQVQYAFLELPKYAAGDEPRTLVEKWAYFFREAKNLTVVPPPLSEGPFRDALEVTRTTAFSLSDWDAYERAKIAEQDARGALALERQEGRVEGRVEELRASIADLCDVLDIERTPARDEAIALGDEESLRKLRDALKRDRRWP
jgi:predicted transposase/invertase (TIGR01784 family)